MPFLKNLPAVLFDLDGTLADTAPDLCYALNQVLQDYQRPPVPLAAIRPLVSQGGAALVQYGFQISAEDSCFPRYRQKFLQYYQLHIHRHTQLFNGMAQVLATLEARQQPWGVVTNKPAWLTEPLMAALKLNQRAACIVSGDTTPERKPHPLPLFYACQQMAVPPEQCWYIGDAERDIAAGRRAGMATLVALFGYLAPEDQPQHWGAHGLIQHPLDILEWVSPYNKS